MPDHSPQRSTCSTVRSLPDKFPIWSWLRTYPLTKWLPGDITAGLSVAMMQMPQNMGYALLASVPVSCGMYATLLPILMYCIMGSSRHASYGMVVFGAMIIGSIVQQEIGDIKVPLPRNHTDGIVLLNNSTGASVISESDLEARKITIAVSATCMSAIILLLMYMLKFGFIASFMSEAFIGGFLVAGNVHVIIRQLKLMLGIKVNSYSGILNIAYLVQDICKHLHETNLVTLLISSVSCVVVLGVKYGINDRYKDKLPIPVPTELFVMVISIILTNQLELNTKYEVATVQRIPQGLPKLSMPTEMHTMLNYIPECITMALSSYILLMLTAKLFAQRYGYIVDNQQELLAAGVCNLAGGFTSAVGIGISPARVFMMDACGGHTQIAHVVSGFVTLLTLLFLAPLMTHLPVCVLGALITTACIPIFERATLLHSYWRRSWYDFSMFVVTFLACLVVDIERGMLIGIGYSALTIGLRVQWAGGAILGRVQREDGNHEHQYYKPSSCYTQTVPTPGVTIYQIQSPICFLTYENIIKQIVTIAENNSSGIDQCKNGSTKGSSSVENSDKSGPLTRTLLPTVAANPRMQSYIILDMSAVNYMDIQGGNGLVKCMQQLHDRQCMILLSNCLLTVYKQIQQNDSFKLLESSMYPSIDDAIRSIENATM